MTLANYLSTCGKDRAAFALEIGVSEASLSRYVLGRRMPRSKVMARIVAATAGCVTPNDFLGVESSQLGQSDAKGVAAAG